VHKRVLITIILDIRLRLLNWNIYKQSKKGGFLASVINRSTKFHIMLQFKNNISLIPFLV